MEKISINYSITKDKIKVESSNNVFISMVRRRTINIIQLDKDIKELRKMCRERKVIFSQKSGLYKFFKENKNNYIKDIADVNSLFDKLIEGWQEKVQKGIYTGYSDDEELNNLYKLEWQINKICMAENISKVSELYNVVEKSKIELQNMNNEITKIVL